MTVPDLIDDLEQALAEMPRFDVHTHLVGGRLGARGLHDILLYHMVISDLYAAGCPNGARLTQYPGWPEPAEAHRRIEEALPIPAANSQYELRLDAAHDPPRSVHWEEPITADNWRRLDAMIRERADDRAWQHSIFDRAQHPPHLCRVRPARDGRRRRAAAIFVGVGVLHPLPMGRVRHGLVRTGALLGPAAGTAVADRRGTRCPGSRPASDRVIGSLDDVHAAIEHYVATIPYEQIVSTATSFSTLIDYRPVGDAEMEAALRRRGQAGPAERDIYASYINEAYLTASEQHADKIVFQFSLGAEPMPYESACILQQRSIYQFAEMVGRHPRLRFQVFLASRHANQAFCTLARELPNLSLAGCWWHNFFPDSMRQVLAERLDMLPVNKQIGFFSDAYCVEWVYGKTRMAQRQLALVLAEKIAQGQYTREDALGIARSILEESPQTLLKMTP